MYKLRVKGRFHAAHSLPWHEKCKKVHGHTYHVEFVVGGHQLDENGIVMDLGVLKKRCRILLEVLDHENLNDTFDNSTAEVVARWLYDSLVNGLKDYKHVCVVEVTVWETPDGGVTYDGEEEWVVTGYE